MFIKEKWKRKLAIAWGVILKQQKMLPCPDKNGGGEQWSRQWKTGKCH
jgi:hypothetical protein